MLFFDGPYSWVRIGLVRGAGLASPVRLDWMEPMVRFSLLVPQRGAAGMVARRLPEWIDVLDGLDPSYEVVVVDDGSPPESLEMLKPLLAEHETFRVIRLDRPGGLAAAVTAGIAAARGDVLIATDASEQYPAREIPRLVGCLARVDLVFGRRHRSRVTKICRSIAGWPDRFLLSGVVHDPDGLFWAARHEAVAGVELGRGMHRYLGPLVAARGFRVDEISVQHCPSARAATIRSRRFRLADLLGVWWLQRRGQAVLSREIVVAKANHRQMRVFPRRRQGSA